MSQQVNVYDDKEIGLEFDYEDTGFSAQSEINKSAIDDDQPIPNWIRHGIDDDGAYTDSGESKTIKMLQDQLQKAKMRPQQKKQSLGQVNSKSHKPLQEQKIFVEEEDCVEMASQAKKPKTAWTIEQVILFLIYEKQEQV